MMEVFQKEDFDKISLNICAQQNLNIMSTITKDTRLIDLTFDQLDGFMEEKLTTFLGRYIPQQDRVGEYELACEVTCYSKNRLYQLVSEDVIPHSKLPNGGVRFFESDLIAWMKKYRNKSEEEIREMSATMLMKRKMRRKN